MCCQLGSAGLRCSVSSVQIALFCHERPIVRQQPRCDALESYDSHKTPETQLPEETLESVIGLFKGFMI